MSKLSSISIRRPVLASVLSIVIVVFGIIAYPNIGIREYPVVESPVITVSTTYTGANADVIEREITEPLELQVNAVSGIRSLTSVSSAGRSLIRVEFDINIDMETAANDVRERVSRAVESLPDDANPPSIRKEDADSAPIVFLNLNSPVRDRLELTALARDVFRERLRTIDGISIVSVWGQQRYAIRLWLDPSRMAAYDITPLDIRQAIDQENVELPSGIIEGEAVELTIRTSGRMSSVEEFESLIIREVNGSTVRFGDVGTAELSTRDDRSVLKRNGQPMVGLAAIPQPGTNQIEAVDEFFSRIDQIMLEMPDDIEVSTGFDTTEFIRESIRDVQTTIIIAFILVLFIIFLFLRDWRTTIIPMLVVPITLIGSFFVIFIAGFTINVLTLLALILAIGLVVDDAIIVLENIYAKLEQGRTPMEAGIEGTREIFFAVISTSLALISVFTPILFLEGVTGKLFQEFGVVIAGAVVISSFVALTLTPMLTTRMLAKGHKKSEFYTNTETYFVQANEWYSSRLDWVLENRKYAITGFGVAVALIALLFYVIPEEVAPMEDRSSLQITATAPEGATFDYMDVFMDQLTRVVTDNVPEIRAFNTVTSPSGTNTGAGFITLVHPSERSRSQQQIAEDLGNELRKLTGALTYVSQPQALSGESGGLPVQFVIQTSDPSNLQEVIPGFLEAARANPAFSFVDVNLKFNRPELLVDVDRNRARALGVTVRDVAQTLQLTYSGSRFGYFDMEGRQYWVVGQVDRFDRNDPSDLRSLYVRNNRNELIQLDNLVTLTETSGPPQLFRFNRLSSATISAALAPGYTIGEGISAMRSVANDQLDDRFSSELSGQSRDFEESVSSLYFIFLLAILFIYLVLSAQFESFRDPLVILITVPLAVFGALLSLWYFGETLNIFSKIAIIMLVGLVTKNGILIVEFANQRQLQGLGIAEAVRDAAKARFRPILMTTLSTVLGVLPLALGFGAGAESRISMGVAVIGGMIVGTLLTLFVIPAMYTYLAEDKKARLADLPAELTDH
ncbi:MAG: efflux RND transporter permease subunit [Balneolales bacterium]|nr:efflux RND transporter permease subunit [Balneolales bacterium]